MTPTQRSVLDGCVSEFRAVLDELVDDRGRYSDAFLLGMVHAQKGGGLAAQKQVAEGVLKVIAQKDGAAEEALKVSLRKLAEEHPGRDEGGQWTCLQPVDDIGLLYDHARAALPLFAALLEGIVAPMRHRGGRCGG